MATINVINSSDPIEVASGGTGVATLTDNGVLVGSGTSDITALSVGTNGQTLIGSTAADPAMAAVTSTGSTITITPGAGTLDFKANILDVIWEEYTGTATTMTTNFGYIANNGAEIEFTLPTTAAVGDLLKVAGKGAGK